MVGSGLYVWRAPRAESRAASASTPTDRFAVGVEETARFALKTSVALVGSHSAGEPPSPGSAQALSIEGRLSATVLRTDAPPEPHAEVGAGVRIWVAYHVEELVVRRQGTTPSDSPALVLPRATERFQGTLTRQGALVEVLYPQQMPPETRNVLTAIVSAHAFGSSDANPGVCERDALGVYEANYVFAGTSAAGARTLERTKLRYVEPAPTNAGVRAARLEVSIIEARRRVELDPAGCPLRSWERERLQVSLGTNGGGLLLERGGTVESLRRAAPLPSAQLAELVALRSSLEPRPLTTEELSPEKQQAAMDQAMVAGHPLPQLLRRITSAAAAPSASLGLPNEAPPEEVLAAHLRLRPETLGHVDELLQGPCTEATANVLLTALSAAGTEPVQLYLVRAMADEQASAAKRQQAAEALLLSQRTTPLVVTQTSAWLDAPPSPFRAGALLVHGRLIDLLRDVDEPARQRAVQLLLGRLKDAGDTPLARELVAALGNTGALESLPALGSLVTSGPEGVKPLAVLALRRIPGDEVDQKLKRWMVEAPTTSVRRAAVQAASFRELARFRRALELVARKDPDASVREAALTALSPLLRAHRELAQLYLATLRDDPEPRLRRLAASQLAVAHDAGLRTPRGAGAQKKP